MEKINNNINVPNMIKTINNYHTEIDKMSLVEESWEDMIDVFDNNNIEEESDNIVNSVLDEIGIKFNNNFNEVDSVPTNINNINNINHNNINITTTTTNNSKILNIVS